MKKDKNQKKIIYYRDELNDEFSSAQITPKRIDANYKYEHTSLWKRFTHFFWYRIVATPIAFVFMKLRFGHKIVGKKALKAAKDTGFFIYGNHTQPIADALIPSFVCMPREVYVIVHPNNVSMPFLGRVTPSMGALPLPDDFEAKKNFIKIVEKRILQKKAVTIYPEAHIWPYYTGIRPFTEASFHYPAKHGVPAFCFTNTYQKRRFSSHPKMVTYVDGPFYPDKSLPQREQKTALRNEVYECMLTLIKSSTLTYIEYKQEEEND